MNTLFSLSLTVKLVLCLFIPLVLDEYYYFLWGQHLSLSYFDHPPMVGWLMTFSQGFRDISEGAIRWPFILLSHATLYVWYLILRSELSEEKLRLFLMTALLNPLWGWGAFIATPDIPLVFFWSLSLLFVNRIIKEPKLSDYLWLGVSLGLGFLSKYQIVLFVPALIVVLWQQQLFQRLFTWKSSITVAIGLITCAPVIFWNFQNEWASFVFQWEHGMVSKHWNWREPLNYIFSQIFLIFPTFLLFVFSKNFRWAEHWLTPFAIFPFVFFLYSSFKGRVEANWVIMAFPAVYALAYLYTREKKICWLKRTHYFWATLFVVAFGFVLFRTSFPAVKTKLTETAKFENVLTFSKNSDLPVVGYSYQMSGYLSFKTRQLVCKLQLYGRIDHFNYLRPCRTMPKHYNFITESRDVPHINFEKFNLKKISVIQIDNTYSAVEVEEK